MTPKDDDVRVLKKKIATQEKQIESQQELIRLLSSLPAIKGETSVKEAPTGVTKTRAPRVRRAREAGCGTSPGAAPAVSR